MAVHLPIRSSHSYASIAARDSSKQHLGDNYVINQSGFTIHTDLYALGHVDFIGHYSSTALRPVTSYVARPELQMQMKERLHDTIEHRGRSSKVLVVCGLGGAGKSQLTLSYIETYRDDYTAVFWIDAGANTRLEADYKQIRNLLHNSDRTDIELDTCVAEVKRWCQHMQGRWLFVFDSADDIDNPQASTYVDLRRVLVDAPSADIIITTRSQSAKRMTTLKAVQVAELTPAEARDLFLRRSELLSSSKEICEEVDAIAKELGFFALATNLAAAYVAETPRLQEHPGGYLDEYRQRQRALLDRKPEAHVDQYGASVLTTWETSYAAMLDRYPKACDLLMFLAFLSPDDLFFELFRTDNDYITTAHTRWILAGTSSASVQEVLDSSLAILRLYSLLLCRGEQSSYSMHKLVHAWSFERSDITSRAKFCKIALEFLRVSGVIVKQEPERAARLVPHIMACFARAREVYAEIDMDKVGIVRGLKRLADFLSISGQSNWGYELYSFVHGHYRRTRCADEYQYYASAADLGDIMRSGGRCEEAVELLRPALAEYREVHGPDDRSVVALSIARTLGCALEKLGKVTEAEPLLRQVLDEYETFEGALTTMRFLALLLTRTNRFKEAEELSELAFDGLKELSGPTAHDTLYALLDYAKVLQVSGQYEKSNALTRHALCDYKDTFGPHNFYTMACMAQTGATSRLLGDFNRANALLEEALFGLERTVGTGSPYTLSCVLELARCLRAQAFYSDALALFERASDGYAAALDSDPLEYLHSSSEEAGLRSFLQRRAALREVLEQASTRFHEFLRRRQHLRRSFSARGRALTYSGGSSGISRQENDLGQQEKSDGSKESVLKTTSVSVKNVTMDTVERVPVVRRRSI